MSLFLWGDPNVVKARSSIKDSHAIHASRILSIDPDDNRYEHIVNINLEDEMKGLDFHVVDPIGFHLQRAPSELRPAGVARPVHAGPT